MELQITKGKAGRYRWKLMDGESTVALPPPRGWETEDEARVAGESFITSVYAWAKPEREPQVAETSRSHGALAILLGLALAGAVAYIVIDLLSAL